MMAQITKCNKCGLQHVVGCECPKSLTHEEVRKQTEKFLKALDRAEKLSKNSTLKFRYKPTEGNKKEK